MLALNCCLLTFCRSPDWDSRCRGELLLCTSECSYHRRDWCHFCCSNRDRVGGKLLPVLRRSSFCVEIGCQEAHKREERERSFEWRADNGSQKAKSRLLKYCTIRQCPRVLVFSDCACVRTCALVPARSINRAEAS